MPGQHESGSCSCGEETSSAASRSLLPYIDLEGVRGLNEAVPHSAVKVFKPFDERLDDSRSCRSADGSPEIMIHVPFITPCKITGFKVIGGDQGTTPKSVKLFANNETLDFESIEDTAPTQAVDLVEDFCGMLEFPVKAAKFMNVNFLTLYFPESFNGESTKLFYIDIRGVGSDYKRNAVVTVYEARANPSDHQVPDELKPSLGQGT